MNFAPIVASSARRLQMLHFKCRQLLVKKAIFPNILMLRVSWILIPIAGIEYWILIGYH